MTEQCILGLGRANNSYDLLPETHLYKFHEGRLYPMCSRGFNRDHGNEFSILRGNWGKIGICQVCIGRERKGKSGLRWHRPRKLKKKIVALEKKRQYNPLLPGLPLVPPPHYFPKHQWDGVYEDTEE